MAPGVVRCPVGTPEGCNVYRKRGAARGRTPAGCNVSDRPSYDERVSTWHPAGVRQRQTIRCYKHSTPDGVVGTLRLFAHSSSGLWVRFRGDRPNAKVNVYVVGGRAPKG